MLPQVDFERVNSNGATTGRLFSTTGGLQVATATCRSVDSSSVALPGNHNLLNNMGTNDCIGYTTGLSMWEEEFKKSSPCQATSPQGYLPHGFQHSPSNRP